MKSKATETGPDDMHAMAVPKVIDEDTEGHKAGQVADDLPPSVHAVVAPEDYKSKVDADDDTEGHQKSKVAPDDGIDGYKSKVSDDDSDSYAKY